MGKSLTRKISEGAVWLSGADVLIKFVGVVYILVVLSNVTVYEYGLIALAMSLIPILGIFNLEGLHPVVVADLVSYKTKSKIISFRYLFSSFVSIKIIAGLAALLVLNAGVLFFDFLPDEPLLMVQILSIVFLLGPVRSGLILLLTTSHKFNSLAQMRLLEEMVKLSLVTFFLVVLQFGAVGVIVGYVISSFLVTLFFVPLGYKIITRDYSGTLFSQGFFDPIFVVRRHAKWSVFQSSLHQVGQNIRPWIIQFLLGTGMVGIFAAAMGLYKQLGSLSPITKILGPIIPEFINQRDRMIKIINSALKYQSIILIASYAATALALPWLLINFFPDYQKAYPLFLLLAISLVPDSFSRIYESVFHALRLQRDLFVANIVKLLMSIIILPVSIIFLGLPGVALEFFLTQTVYALSRYKVLRVKLQNFEFNFSDLIRFTETDVLLIKKSKAYIKSHLTSFR